uniref:Putative adenylate cyclase terminal-differentiation specific n=1 Tax=Rhipicephalus microplus TaxID=6941 RepID=A0A6G5ADJ0_RHIMP
MWLSQKQQEIKNREESLKQLMEQRSQEIYQEIKAQQRKSFEAAERESMVQEEFWIEQEKKAKEVEKQIREIARIAREEHKRALHLGNGKTLASVDMREPVMSLNGKPPVPPKVVPPTLPATPPPNLVVNGTSNGSIKNGITTITTTTTGSPTTVMPSHATSRSKDAELFSRADIIQWFLKEEYPRGAVTDHNGNNLAAWFHGFIGRPESEQLLQRHGGAAAGAFLVRVHERIKGYVISYWAGDRCKHYLIDASLGHCQFFWL